MAIMKMDMKGNISNLEGNYFAERIAWKYFLKYFPQRPDMLKGFSKIIMIDGELYTFLSHHKLESYFNEIIANNSFECEAEDIIKFAILDIHKIISFDFLNWEDIQSRESNLVIVDENGEKQEICDTLYLLGKTDDFEMFG